MGCLFKDSPGWRPGRWRSSGAQELSNPEVAARLHIAEATVKTHLLGVFNKLAGMDRTQAVALAMERGLL